MNEIIFNLFACISVKVDSFLKKKFHFHSNAEPHCRLNQFPCEILHSHKIIHSWTYSSVDCLLRILDRLRMNYFRRNIEWRIKMTKKKPKGGKKQGWTHVISYDFGTLNTIPNNTQLLFIQPWFKDTYVSSSSGLLYSHIISYVCITPFDFFFVFHLYFSLSSRFAFIFFLSSLAV